MTTFVVSANWLSQSKQVEQTEFGVFDNLSWAVIELLRIVSSSDDVEMSLSKSAIYSLIPNTCVITEKYTFDKVTSSFKSSKNISVIVDEKFMYTYNNFITSRCIREPSIKNQSKKLFTAPTITERQRSDISIGQTPKNNFMQFQNKCNETVKDQSNANAVNANAINANALSDSVKPVETTRITKSISPKSVSVSPQNVIDVNGLLEQKTKLTQTLEDINKLKVQLFNDKREFKKQKDKKEQQRRVFDSDYKIYFSIKNDLANKVIKDIPSPFTTKYTIFQTLEENNKLSDVEESFKVYNDIINAPKEKKYMPDEILYSKDYDDCNDSFHIRSITPSAETSEDKSKEKSEKKEVDNQIMQPDLVISRKMMDEKEKEKEKELDTFIENSTDPEIVKLKQQLQELNQTK